MSSVAEVLLPAVNSGKLFPDAFKQGTCFTDFWEAYQAVIPDEQHQAVGKDSGLTAHVERFNSTIRQRLARFVRKTLSFSKSDEMHLICLHLFPTATTLNGLGAFFDRSLPVFL